MSNQQPAAQPTSRTGPAILAKTEAVKSDTEQILGLLTDRGEGEDRIDKILAALALLVEETTAMRAELADLRAGLKPSR